MAIPETNVKKLESQEDFLRFAQRLVGDLQSKIRFLSPDPDLTPAPSSCPFLLPPAPCLLPPTPCLLPPTSCLPILPPAQILDPNDPIFRRSKERITLNNMEQAAANGISTQQQVLSAVLLVSQSHSNVNLTIFNKTGLRSR